ncbi:MAG: MerR family transcriptional regulator [Candidatus Saccharimonadales bacterium]
MYRIGMFSKLGLVTIKTLHHYDEVGLLKPAHIDDENGYRYYDSSQLFRLGEIVQLRQMGFSIPEITAIIDGHNIANILKQRKLELENEMHDASARLSRLENYINERKEGYKMDYQAVIKDLPEFIVFAAKYTIPNYAALNTIMPGLGEKVSKANPDLKCVQPGYCFNVYLDGEYRDADINVEICEAVVKKGKDGDGFIFKTVPAVKVVSVLHRGAYGGLGKAYAYAIQWVEQNGYKVVDNIRESYIDGIWNKDDAKDCLTEIQVPIEKI